MENNRKGATTVQHPKVISCRDRTRRYAEVKQETPTGDTGKACKTAATALNVLAYPETEAPADDTTPMVLTPPLVR